MKYYKYLDLDWKPARDKILEILKTYPNSFFDRSNNSGAFRQANTDLFRIPEIHEMFRPLGISIQFISLYVTFSKIGVIHKDDVPGYISRIIFPILNCEESETKFYTVSEEPIKLEQPNGLGYNYYDPIHCKHVDSYFLTQPAVFHVREAHQVCIYRDLELPRISCTVQFHQDINYLVDE